MPSRKGRILIAEDIPMNHEICRAILRKDGHETALAISGAEAVEKVKNGSYDLVLMDIEMPGMNGFEAARKIREELGVSGDQMPILAFTSHIGPEEVRQAFESGMDDFLPKPVQPGILCKRVDYWLSRGDLDVFEEAMMLRESNIEEFDGEPPLVDTIGIDSYIGILGLERLAGLFGSFRKDFDQRSVMFSDSTVRETLIDELHTLVSTSGTLGMLRLSHACRALMNDLRDGKANDRQMRGTEILNIYKESIAGLEAHIAKLRG